MNKRVALIVALLGANNVEVKKVRESRNQLEYHEIEVSASVHIQVSTEEEFYVMVVRQIIPDYEFKFWHMRFDGDGLLRDLAQALAEEKSAS